MMWWFKPQLWSEVCRLRGPILSWPRWNPPGVVFGFWPSFFIFLMAATCLPLSVFSPLKLKKTNHQPRPRQADELMTYTTPSIQCLCVENVSCVHDWEAYWGWLRLENIFFFTIYSHHFFFFVSSSWETREQHLFVDCPGLVIVSKWFRKQDHYIHSSRNSEPGPHVPVGSAHS